MNQYACDKMVTDDVVVRNRDSLVLGDVIVRKPQLLCTSGPYRKHYSDIVIGDIITETRSSYKK
jgi:hypothetical protein